MTLYILLAIALWFFFSLWWAMYNLGDKRREDEYWYDWIFLIPTYIFIFVVGSIWSIIQLIFKGKK